MLLGYHDFNPLSSPPVLAWADFHLLVSPASDSKYLDPCEVSKYVEIGDNDGDTSLPLLLVLSYIVYGLMCFIILYING